MPQLLIRAPYFGAILQNDLAIKSLKIFCTKTALLLWQNVGEINSVGSIGSGYGFTTFMQWKFTQNADNSITYEAIGC